MDEDKELHMTHENQQTFDLIDTHCHLEMSRFDPDRDEVIRRAREAGVAAMITIGSDPESNPMAVALAEKHEDIYASVGIHPHDAKLFDEKQYALLAKWASHPRVVAVGETGLDFHYDHSPRDVQKKVFRRHLKLSLERNLPAVIHSRKAEEDTLRILRESGVKRGVMHFFSGGRKTLEESMALGLYISIAGPVTFRDAKKLKDVAALVPDDYLLLETDAPYLAPEPMRGKRNEPAFVVHTAREVARLRNVSLEDVARITTLNARRLFGIGELPAEGRIAYQIRDSLYLNITNRCTNSCSFCIRTRSDFVKGHNLRLRQEPDVEALRGAIGEPSAYREVVFCGYGEPLLRLDVVKELSAWIKSKGGRVRINTNGHGNLIHGRNVIPELAALVDSVSVSLDAPDAETYDRLCMPSFKGAFGAVVDFIREAGKHVPDVEATVVEMEGVDVEKCRALAGELSVRLRVRELHAVG